MDIEPLKALSDTESEDHDYDGDHYSSSSHGDGCVKGVQKRSDGLKYLDGGVLSLAAKGRALYRDGKTGCRVCFMRRHEIVPKAEPGT